MKRLLIGTLAFVLSLSFGARVLAGGGDADAKPRVDFSAKAAGIQALVKAEADTATTRLARVTAAVPVPQATTSKKSFWKTPWPYVIIGGAIAAGVLIANGSNSAY
jgi:hypothetical protein